MVDYQENTSIPWMSWQGKGCRPMTFVSFLGKRKKLIFFFFAVCMDYINLSSLNFKLEITSQFTPCHTLDLCTSWRRVHIPQRLKMEWIFGLV